MKIHIVAPAFNESEGISRFVSAVRASLASAESSRSLGAQLIIVDDGSSDSTFERLTELCRAPAPSGSAGLLALRLSRNFGQQAALHAGLREAFARAMPGDLFVLMDSDLQHPPELLPPMIQRLLEGIPHVQMVRKDHGVEGAWKRWTSSGFYWLFRRFSDVPLTPGAADFRGMSYAFVQAYLSLPESNRFNRGLFAWVGFEKLEVPYEVAPRLAGRTKYTSSRMFRNSLLALTQFSSRPLIAAIGFSVVLSILVCVVYLAYEIHRAGQGIQFVLGWPSMMFFVAFWSGLILFGELMLAIYVSRIFDEVKRRPVYLVSESKSTESTHAP